MTSVKTMIGTLLKPELIRMLEERRFAELREALSQFPPVDVAEIFRELDADEQAVLLRLLPYQHAADVFEYLEHEDQEKLLYALGNERVSQILNEMSPDDRTAILEELPASAVQKLLPLLSPDQRKVAVELLGYPKDSVGRRMTPNYVALQRDWAVTKVLAFIRQYGKERETLHDLFAVDPGGRLLGVLTLRDLVLADLDVTVEQLMETQFVSLRADDDQETAVNEFQKYDATALPVVNSRGVLVGLVTVDDVLDVAEEEATEDMQKMSGMEVMEGAYLRVSLLQLVRKRAGWLSVLMMGEMLTATTMAFFEFELSHAVVLALFVPLIISSGGNSGSQATSLIIRAMALKDVNPEDWWRVLRRELLAGFMLGITLAIIIMLRFLLWPNAAHTYGEHYLLLGVAVGCSLIGVVTFGCLTGSMLPFVLRRMGFDPAVSSAPLVATLVDVTGLVIYFLTARLILSGTLL